MILGVCGCIPHVMCDMLYTHIRWFAYFGANLDWSVPRFAVVDHTHVQTMRYGHVQWAWSLAHEPNQHHVLGMHAHHMAGVHDQWWTTEHICWCCQASLSVKAVQVMWVRWAQESNGTWWMCGHHVQHQVQTMVERSRCGQTATGHITTQSDQSPDRPIHIPDTSHPHAFAVS